MCLFNLFKKKKKAEPQKVETPVAEEKKVETPVEEPKQAPVEEPKAEVKEEPKAEVKEEPKAEVKEEPKQEEKPAEASVEEAPAEEEPIEAVIDEAPIEVPTEGKKVYGKFEFDIHSDGYHFRLYANNGQLLFDGPAFTTLEGAQKGVETFKKAVNEGTFLVHEDKFGRFRYVLNRKYAGENYKRKEQCERSIESVKYFTNNSKMVEFEPTAEELEHYENAKKNLKKVGDVNWDEVKEAEANAQKFGKFLVCQEGEFYVFYLLANNGQILFASRTYSDKAGVLNGVESFKRCAYIGNFFIDPDKFGNHRFVLKNVGSAPAFVGESYNARSKVVSIIESVKKFIVTAPTVFDEEKEEPEDK